MGLAYFGSNGIYTSTDSTAISAQMLNATNYGNITYSGLLSGLGTASIGNGVSQQPNTQSLTDYLTKVSQPAKRAAKGVLAKLREEIDGWHGDVLERCPA